MERDLLAREVARLRDQAVLLEQCKLCLIYDDLKPDGVLGLSVKEFIFFPDFDCNEVFLELINYGEQTFICSWMQRRLDVLAVQTQFHYEVACGLLSHWIGLGGHDWRGTRWIY